jgi:hypothetical protein
MLALSPALHIDPKSRFGPCDEARAVQAVFSAARGIEVPLPILFGRRHLGHVVGNRGSNHVLWNSDPRVAPLDLAGFPSLENLRLQSAKNYRWSQNYYKTFIPATAFHVV